MKNRSQKQEKTGESFFEHLLRSHMYVAAIGALSLLLALAALFLQLKNTELLSNKAIPIAQATASLSLGVEHSLASMRGWVSLRDKQFTHEWSKVWADEIDPAVNEMTQLGLELNLPGIQKKTSELSLLLKELKVSQWWVFEIAQTPGNEPARVVYQFEADPVFFNLDAIMLHLLSYEKWGYDTVLQKEQLTSLHDLGILYYQNKELLQRIIFIGDIGLEEQYFRSLKQIRTLACKLSRYHFPDDSLDRTINQCITELGALERVSKKSIAIRKSDNWNVTRRLMRTETVPLTRRIFKIMNQISVDIDNLVIHQSRLTRQRGYLIAISLSVLFVIMVAAAIILSRIMALALSRPVVVLANAAEQLAAGTLTEDIVPEQNNELGLLTLTFNNLRRDLQESQAQLLRQERMAAIGQLSGSVAHDIRNPLAAINSSIYFIQLVSNEKTDPKIREHISLMANEINRAIEIINDLLEYSRKNVPSLSNGDLNACLEQLVSRVNPVARVSVDLQFDEEMPIIAFDSSQLQRVFNNLITNALQAMPDGGTLRVHTSHDDKWVSVAISDTGHGITTEDQGRIFDPLFTTKASGVGLGLSIVKDFIEKHHGRIEVNSMLEKGTCFTVYLPVTEVTDNFRNQAPRDGFMAFLKTGCGGLSDC